MSGTAVSSSTQIVCRRPRILLGGSGSVAAIKVVELAYLLAEFAEVKLVLTKAARHFVQHDDLPFTIHGVACTILLWRLTCLLKFVPEIPCALLPGVFSPTFFSDIAPCCLPSLFQATDVFLEVTVCQVHAVHLHVNCFQGDEEEWHQWQKKGDPVLHIELRKWADLLLVAPLSANTLAKMAQGLCDNCLTSVVRAWDFSKPLMVRGSDCCTHWATLASA
ncbi:hypothetical protein ABBQ32_010803 [Trebouxia sp. C0010 RCD-2024]